MKWRIFFPFKVINTLIKLLIQLVSLWVSDALGNLLLFWLINNLNTANLNSFPLLSGFIKAIIITINAVTIWQTILDIIDFIHSAQVFGFKIL